MLDFGLSLGNYERVSYRPGNTLVRMKIIRVEINY